MENHELPETKGKEQVSPVRARLAKRDPRPRLSESELQEKLDAASNRRNAYLSHVAEKAKRYNEQVTSSVATRKFIEDKDSQLKAAQLAWKLKNAESRSQTGNRGRRRAASAADSAPSIWSDEGYEKVSSDLREYIPKRAPQDVSKHKRSKISWPSPSTQDTASSGENADSNSNTEFESDSNSQPPSPPRIFSPRRPERQTPVRLWLSEGSDSPSTIEKKMTHRLQVANAARDQAIKERAGKARAKEAARVSRTALHTLEQQRERTSARLQIEGSLTEAEKRRNSQLAKRKEEAAKHVQMAKAVASRVKAAKGVQQWWRGNLQKWRSQQGKGVRRRIRAQNDSKLLSTWLEHAKHKASALELVGIRSLEDKYGKDSLFGHASVSEVLGKAHQQSLSKRFLNDVQELRTAASTIKEASKRNHFEKAAMALQQSSLVGIAQRFSKAISVWAAAGRKEILKVFSHSSDSPEFAMQLINPKQITPSTYPTFARSARTFLVALLVRYFPDEALGKGSTGESPLPDDRDSDSAGETDGASSPDEDFKEVLRLRRNDLETAARYFTDAFYEFLDDPKGEERPESSETERFYYRVAFLNATWCQFMKAFVGWKKADGERLASALEGPFRTALASLYRYQAQVRDEADGGPGKAQPGTGRRPTPGTSQMVYSYEHQLATLRAQLLRLLGREGLETWEQGIIREVKRDIRREREQEARARESDSEAESSPSERGEAQPPTEGEQKDSTYKDGSAGNKRKAVTSPDRGSGAPESLPQDTEVPVGSSMSAGWKHDESGKETKEESKGDKKAEMPKSIRGSPRIRAMRGWMENEDVVHELLLNSEFRIEDEKEPALPTIEALESGKETPRFAGKRPGNNGGAMLSQFALSPSASISSAGGSSPTTARSTSFRKDTAKGSQESKGEDTGEEEAPSTPPRKTKPRIPSVSPLLGPSQPPQDIQSRLRSAMTNELMLRNVARTRDELTKLCGRNQSLSNEVQSRLDVELLQQMAENKALDTATWKGVTTFIGDMLLRLEAPARNEHTRSVISRVVTNLSKADASADSAEEGIPPLVFDICMDFFRWVYFKLDQIRIDTSNFHLSMLLPHLQHNRKGVEYERQAFSRSLSSQSTSLKGTTRWLSYVTQHPIKAHGVTDPSELSKTVVSRLQAMSRDGPWSALLVLRDGVLNVLSSDVAATRLAEATMTVARQPSWRGQAEEEAAYDAALREVQEMLSIPEASVVFPETLRLDAKRLEKLQNDLQMAALISALPSLVFASLHITPEAKDASTRVAVTYQNNSGASGKGIEGISGGSPPSPPVVAGARLLTVADLRRRVFYWLQDENLRMPSLIANVIRVAKELQTYYNSLHAWASSTSSTSPLSNSKPASAPATDFDAARLKSAVERVVSSDHSMFRLAHSRGIEWLRSFLTLAILPPTAGQQTREEARIEGAPDPAAASMFESLPEEFQSTLKANATTLARVISHTWAVHGPFYRMVALKVARDASSAAEAK